MRYYVLLCLVTGGAYAVAHIVSALAVSAAWARSRTRLHRMRAAPRAQAIALMQLAPAAIGMAWAAVIASVFVRFEPRDTAESPGLLLIAAAAGSAALFLLALSRLAVALRGSLACSRLLRHCGREWKHAGRLPIWVVDTSYPVAAVAGIFRTRLIVSSKIVGECSDAEMEAIVRHEAAHLRRRDNLVRAAMACLPDVMSLVPAGAAMRDAWSAAVEQAADDEATGMDARARTNLAAALLRVAGMVQGAPPAWMAGTVAFYEGTNLEQRVCRLLAPATTGRARPFGGACVALLACATGILIATDGAASLLHTAMEFAVRRLP